MCCRSSSSSRSLFSILYYLGVMQFFVKGMALIMQRFMGTSGAESTSVAASIVMGQTEAPLTIRPFLEKLTDVGVIHDHDERHGACLRIRDGCLCHDCPVSISHLLTAVIMTAPATMMLAKMFMPESGTPVTRGRVDVKVEQPGVNLIDAAARGAGDGLHLALNIAGMLIAFLALIAMVNGGLGWVHSALRWFPVSLQQVLALVFAPIAWLLGVTWNDCATVGNLLGTRMVLNEFVAFVDLGQGRADA